jgi:hypothetical protein
MLPNLAKSPLIALFFGALLYLAGAYIPYSETYTALAAAFSATLSGTLFLLLFAFWLSLAAAVCFGAAERGGVRTIALLTVAMLGAVWLVPSLEALLYTGHAGVLTRADALVSMGFYSACTVIAMALFALLYRTQAKTKPANPHEAAQQSPVSYKLKTMALIIKIIVLPLVYAVLFFVVFYFLHWNKEEIRVFYGGQAENLGFIASVVRILLDNGWMLMLALAKGLSYTLFALPLLFLFPGKRAIYIVMTVLLNLSGAIWLLIPTPIMTDAIRFSNLLYTAVLTFAFSVLMAFLLHTCFRREVKAAAPQRPPMTPQQVALAKAQAAAAKKPSEATVKTAAAAVSATMRGKG